MKTIYKKLKVSVVSFIFLNLSLVSIPLPLLQAADLLSPSTDISVPSVSVSEVDETEGESLDLSPISAEISPLSEVEDDPEATAREIAAADFAKRLGVKNNERNIIINRSGVGPDAFYFVELTGPNGKASALYGGIRDIEGELVITNAFITDARTDLTKSRRLEWTYEELTLTGRLVFQDNTTLTNSAGQPVQITDILQESKNGLLTRVYRKKYNYDLSTPLLQDINEAVSITFFYTDGKIDKKEGALSRYAAGRETERVKFTGNYANEIPTAYASKKYVYDLSTPDLSDWTELVNTLLTYNANGKRSQRERHLYRFDNAIGRTTEEVVFKDTYDETSEKIILTEGTRIIYDTSLSVIGIKKGIVYTAVWKDSNENPLRKDTIQIHVDVRTGVETRLSYRVDEFENNQLKHRMVQGSVYSDSMQFLGDYTFEADYSNGVMTAAHADIFLPGPGSTKIHYRVIYDFPENRRARKTRVFDDAGNEITLLGGTGFILPSSIIKKFTA